MYAPDLGLVSLLLISFPENMLNENTIISDFTGSHQ